jgi:hemoglobin
MTRQRNHQKRFLTQAFGGPAHYSGRMMRAAHKHLNLKEADFNAVAENLNATLRDLKVPESLIDESIQIVAASKADVLNL